MRAKEFIFEDNSESRAASNLLTVLDNLRNRTSEIRVDSLINMVRRIPGSEMFNAGTLLSTYEKNPAVKQFIKDIKDDPNGIKYIYLTPTVNEPGDEIDVSTEPEEPTAIKSPEKTIDQMSKRALKRRS